MKLADFGVGMFVALHWMHDVAAVVVGRVVWPAGHGEHVLDETA
jgi:hypothetical protein